MITGMGGGGGAALLAEMRAKRQTMKPDDNKENQGVRPSGTRPASAILKPTPAPRSASPNTQGTP